MAKLSRQQYWEIGIISTIVLIIIYRVALVYGYIPPQYHPSVLLDDVYVATKVELKEVQNAHNVFSDAAAWSLQRLDSMEKYMKEKKKRMEQAEIIAKRCNENSLFRFFMYMGDEDNTSCSEKNMVVNNAVKDINADTKKPDTNATTYTVLPQQPAANNP